MSHLKNTKIFSLISVLIFGSLVLPFLVFSGRVHAAPPKCYRTVSFQEVDCEMISGSPLEDDKCYTERRSGPNATLVGYNETSCADPTDRDQDGDPGGADNSEGGNFEADCESETLTKDTCGIINYLVLIIRVLSGLVGIVVVMMIIIGGIQYSTAQGNPQAVAAARKRIGNALLALLVYIFAFAFLQWLVPGGIL